jgi:hypothetical protein
MSNWLRFPTDRDILEASRQTEHWTFEELEQEMSRSVRKTPIIGIAGDSDKSFKKAENKRKRAQVKVALNNADDLENVELPDEKEYGDPWASNKDGKQYLGWDTNPKWMRK